MKGKNEPASDRKRERIATALKILINKKKMTYKKAVALLCWNLGLTQAKAREYIDTLIEIDGIKRDGDMIVRRK
jgi:hypothetical protein